MPDLNYYDTLITVAEDCGAAESRVPEARGGKRTVAVIQYEMLVDAPFVHTQEDVLFQSWYARQDLPPETPETERERLREAFFAKPQACLRSSPLPKQYGWGFLFDAQGRVALCPMESEEYGRLARGEGGVKVLRAMRSKRA